MATGISSSAADAAIDAVVALGTWIQLHTGDPGAAGTSNVATEDTRMEASFAAASGGSASTDADLTWSAVAATETVTHFSMWTAATSGTFLWSGTVTNGELASGQDFTVESGDLTLTISGAS